MSTSPSSRLTASDWVQAGFDLLSEEGPGAIKIDRLAAALGVTKGSFYWHFADLQAYLDAIAEAWQEYRDQARKHVEGLAYLEPRERLTEMLAAFREPRQWTLERAVREWGRKNPSVAKRVRASDAWVFAAFRKAFLDAGFSRSDADLRAQAIFFSGVGMIHVGNPLPNARQMREQERFLDLLMTRVD